MAQAKNITETQIVKNGSGVVTFPSPIGFSNGLYVVVGGTADLTIHFQ